MPKSFGAHDGATVACVAKAGHVSVSPRYGSPAEIASVIEQQGMSPAMFLQQ